jgi:hypothetical protein
VAWSDNRAGSSDIYAARVTPKGTVLDPVGIPVSTAANWQAGPAVAFDGANYLVVWTDTRADSGDIYAARVTPQGTVLDSSGIRVATADDYNHVHPAVAFDGTNYLVVWSPLRSGSGFDIYAARVTPQGMVLDPEGIPVSTAADDQLDPAVAFDGASFLVLWVDHRGGNYNELYGARVSPQGAVLDTSGIKVIEGGFHWSPALVFDGANFLAVYQYFPTTHPSSIRAARLTPQGAVLNDLHIWSSTTQGDENSPAIDFDGASFLVVWSECRPDSGGHIHAARVTPAGVVSDSGAVGALEGNQAHPALARGPGDQMLLVYRGWAGKVGGKTYNNCRIWGKFVEIGNQR